MGLLTKYERMSESKGVTFTPIDAAWNGFGGGLPGTRFSYRSHVREGLDSNVVMSPVSWVMRNFTEAEVQVERRTGDDWDYVDDHPLRLRMEEPNGFYDGDALFKATVLSYVMDGNAYWLKMRNTFGVPVELWYLPHFLVTPEAPSDGSRFIEHYAYRPHWGGRPLEIAPRDIVHLRYGLDPRDPKRGVSALKTLLREIYTDEEAANFSASIMRNMGVPGGLIAPKDHQSLPTEKDVEAMKAHMTEGFVGDKRGQWLVLGSPTTVEQFGFDPNTLNVASLRDIAEERVCAAVGVPPSVVGFGAGLQQTKVGATQVDNRKSAWENTIIPHQRTIGRQLTRQLVPDFQMQTNRFRVRFDTRHVPAIGAEETEVAERAVTLFQGGVLSRPEAREMVGYPPEVDEEPRALPDAEPSQNGARPEPGDEAEQVATRAAALLRGWESKRSGVTR